MKKNYAYLALIFILLVFTSANAQSTAKPAFISKILPPIPVEMWNSSQLHVAYIAGTVDGSNAFSLEFENKTDAPLTFVWKLNDETGLAMSKEHTITLKPYEKINVLTHPEMFDILVFTSGEHSQPGSCVISININD